MPRRPRVTVGVVGLGFGRAHLVAYQDQGCQVVAVCQRDQAAARRVADRFGVPRVYDRWEAMLEAERLDIVSVAAPPHLRRPIVEAALGRGAHVLCEKPLALNLAEARAMVAAAARAGRVAMTCFNWREPAAMQKLHAMVEAGFVGQPLHVSARFLVGRWADEGAPPTWRMDREVAGHGAMGDLGVRLIDSVRWNVGEFARVRAHAGIAYPSRTVPGGGRPADAEDFCTLEGELAGGAHVTITVSRVARGVHEQSLDIFGARGALRYRLRRDVSRWHLGSLEAAAERHPLVPVRFSAGRRSPGTGDPIEVTGRATVSRTVARLPEGIKTGRTPSPSLADGARAMAVLDAVAASLAAGGAWQEVARD